jgi:hypothetical protein
MKKETKVEVTRTEAQGGLGSHYILMLIMKSLANFSMLGSLIALDREYSNRGLKDLPSKPLNPPAYMCLLMSLYSLNSQKRMGGRRLFTWQSPNTMDGQN